MCEESVPIGFNYYTENLFSLLFIYAAWYVSPFDTSFKMLKTKNTISKQFIGSFINVSDHPKLGWVSSVFVQLVSNAGFTRVNSWQKCTT